MKEHEVTIQGHYEVVKEATVEFYREVKNCDEKNNVED